MSILEILATLNTSLKMYLLQVAGTEFDFTLNLNGYIWPQYLASTALQYRLV